MSKPKLIYSTSNSDKAHYIWQKLKRVVRVTLEVIGPDAAGNYSLITTDKVDLGYLSKLGGLAAGIELERWGD